MSSIQAENIQVAYDDRVIIEKLSTRIPSGKISTIIGANGCGKSTLLKALTRILPLQEGAIYFDGQAIAQLPTKEVAKNLPYFLRYWKRQKEFLSMNWSLMGAIPIKMDSAISPIRIGRRSTGL